MGDSDDSQKNPAIPSWQAELKNATPTEGDSEPQSPSRETLVQQAKKFLEEDEVRNASTDKKISFLENKGLTSEEIQGLLGVVRHTEASAPPPSTATSTSSPPRPTYSVTPPQNTPPVITYPEFLTTPTQPTPLVTTSRLRTTLYLFGGLSALLYGTSNYLITPMLASLTESRLSLASTTSSNLSKLITKLESVVSEVPPRKPHHDALTHPDTYHDDEESDEDPTEMFHRDVGVQTSTPPTPRSPSPSSANPTTDQETRLKSLSSRISSLLEDSTSEGQETSDLTTTITMLREYLDGLAYVAPTFGYGVGGYGGQNQNNKEDDEIGRVKASIRGVKGVLLSARSFPGVSRTAK